MRIWDIPANQLCDRHLLGEHAELHATWSILHGGLRGYRNHPEVRRWKGRLRALASRHDEQVVEFGHRGFRHESPLLDVPIRGPTRQEQLVEPLAEQIRTLGEKGCACRPLATSRAAHLAARTRLVSGRIKAPRGAGRRRERAR